MLQLPTILPIDAVDLLYAMLTGTIPFDQLKAETAIWNLQGYGLTQKIVSIVIEPGPQSVTAEEVGDSLAKNKRGIPIPWDVLIPGLINLIMSTFFPDARGKKPVPAKGTP